MATKHNFFTPLCNSILLCILLLTQVSCSEQISEEERIKKEVDTTSVHLMLGLKRIIANPDNDPDIESAQQTLHQILTVQDESKASKGLSVQEIAQVAKIGYLARQLGKQEVALGKSSDFAFVNSILKIDETDDITPYTLKQDHAATLAALMVIKLHPAFPFPITQEQLLYEAWMADDAVFNHDYMNFLLKAAQASTFANNNFCDLAQRQTQWFVEQKIPKVNPERIIASLKLVLSLGPAAAHVPDAVQAIASAIMIPAIIELLPNSTRLTAHINTAKCYQNRGDDDQALQQQVYAVDTLEQIGAPENEIALYRALLSYKKGDLESTAQHLRMAAHSRLLDERSKKDILQLADNLKNPDDTLVDKYLSNVNLSILAGKIINQRLADEGVYDKIQQSLQLARLKEMLSVMKSTNTDELLDKSTDALNQGKQWLENFTNN